MTDRDLIPLTREPQLHVMYDGVSRDIDLDSIDVGSLSSDNEIRRAVANFLEVPEGKMQNFDIDRNEDTGDLTLRPRAVFGGFENDDLI